MCCFWKRLTQYERWTYMKESEKRGLPVSSGTKHDQYELPLFFSFFFFFYSKNCSVAHSTNSHDEQRLKPSLALRPLGLCVGTADRFPTWSQVRQKCWQLFVFVTGRLIPVQCDSNPPWRLSLLIYAASWTSRSPPTNPPSPIYCHRKFQLFVLAVRISAWCQSCPALTHSHNVTSCIDVTAIKNSRLRQTVKNNKKTPTEMLHRGMDLFFLIYKKTL